MGRVVFGASCPAPVANIFYEKASFGSKVRSFIKDSKLAESVLLDLFMNINAKFKAPDKRGYQVNRFLISLLKRTLRVLSRSAL